MTRKSYSITINPFWSTFHAQPLVVAERRELASSSIGESLSKNTSLMSQRNAARRALCCGCQYAKTRHVVCRRKMIKGRKISNEFAGYNKQDHHHLNSLSFQVSRTRACSKLKQHEGDETS